jgi:hypothetical protein
VADRDWARRQLDKRGPGETLVHAAACKDSEGEKGWLVVSDQRVWYFQKGLIARSEEYVFDSEIRFQQIPFSFGKKVMLVIAGEPFTMSTAEADEFVAVVRRAREQE